MKKNKKIIMMLVIGLLLISCGKKEEKKENVVSTENTSSGVTNTQNGAVSLGNLQNNSILNLTIDEQNMLLNNNIDPAKVSEAIKEAENGNKEAILSLSKLYYDLKDMTKVKKYLQLGVDKNVNEAIYNLAMIYKDEGNVKEAEKLLAKLPKDSLVGEMPAGAEEYNKGIELIKSKKYKEAKSYFEKAYKKGLKDADIQIAVLNKELKNIDEAIKWYKIAAKRGVQGANLELGATLFDSGKVVEARPYLEKEYKNGNKSLAMPIAISYDRENKIEEALKWYKIAAKNGDKDAAVAVKEIENNLNSTKYFLGNLENNKNEQKNSKFNIKNTQNNSNVEIRKEEEKPLIKTESTIPTIKNKNINEIENKKNYDVNID